MRLYISGYVCLSHTTRGTMSNIVVSTVSSRVDPADHDALHEPVCRWNSVETHLQDSVADVLTIMDSCYASAVIYRHNGDAARSFETLAATNDYSPTPGPNSFTRALIISLAELYNEHYNESSRTTSFDTSLLHARIMRRMHDNRRQHHIPPLLNRTESLNARHICLAPLSNQMPQSLPRNQRAKGVLSLQVVFAKHNRLSKSEVTLLASSLANGAKTTSLDIIALEWVAFEGKVPYLYTLVNVMKLIKLWVNGWRRRKKLRAIGLAQIRARPSQHLSQLDYGDDVVHFLRAWIRRWRRGREGRMIGLDRRRARLQDQSERDHGNDRPLKRPRFSSLTPPLDRIPG